MKFEGILFPHPVLGRDDDVQGKYCVVDPIYIRGKETSKITVEHELFNDPITELLKNGNAAFATEVHCKNTGYRETFSCLQGLSNRAIQEIEIPNGRLRAIVETMSLVVATKTFRYSFNNSWNTDYNGKIFTVKKGMPLAYGGEARIDIPEENDGKKGGQSFIRIIMNDGNKNGPFDVNLDDDPIVVVLSRKDFDMYSKLSRRSENSQLFISSIALPAISYAIANMEGPSGCSFNDCKWYQAIDARMQTSPELAELEKTEVHSIKAAQIILKSPLGKMLEQMMTIEDENGNDDVGEKEPL
jgi:hypothetical protein